MRRPAILRQLSRTQMRAGAFILTLVIIFALLVSPHLRSNRTSVDANHHPRVITIEELARMIDSKSSFLVQIELQHCPACSKLRAQERKSPTWNSIDDKYMLYVAAEDKETTRDELKKLLPMFNYYPSLYYIRDSKIAEFNLDTIDNFEERLSDWILENQGKHYAP